MLVYFEEKLKTDVLNICNLINKNSGVAYLVGGCLRDAFLEHEVFDADIEVYNIEPVKLKKILSSYHRVDLVGKSYAVFKMQQLKIDISVPRLEKKTNIGHKGFAVDAIPDLSFKEAALRRDFTVNSMLYDPLRDQLIDNYGGLTDIKHKKLKHVSAKFTEDPLRPLRAMQFVSRLGFDVDQSTIELCKQLHQDQLPAERIFAEWKKMILTGKFISKGLNFLSQIGWLKYYPELKALQSCPQDKKWHPEGDVWQHTLACMDAFAHNRHFLASDQKNDLEMQEDMLIVGLSVLTHDFGKPATTYFEGDKIRSTGHEVIGLPLVKRFLERMTNQSRIIDNCLLLCKYHMQPFVLYKNQSSEAAIRRLSARVQRLDRLIEVCRADYLGCGRNVNTDVEHLDWLKKISTDMQLLKLAPKPILMGRHLLELGVKPGVVYKKILNKCYEAQLEGSFKNIAEGIMFLKKLLKDQLNEHSKII